MTSIYPELPEPEEWGPFMYQAARERARRAGRSRNAAELEFLIACMSVDRRDRGPSLSLVAAAALAELDPTLATSAITDSLTSNNAHLRATATYSLGRIPEPRCAVMLVACLYDTSVEVVGHALLGLSRTQQFDVLPVLELRLWQSKENLPMAALILDALHKVSCDPARAIIRRFLASRTVGEQSELLSFIDLDDL